MSTTLLLTEYQLCQVIKAGLEDSGNGTGLRLEYQSKARVASVEWDEESEIFSVALDNDAQEPC